MRALGKRTGPSTVRVTVGLTSDRPKASEASEAYAVRVWAHLLVAPSASGLSPSLPVLKYCIPWDGHDHIPSQPSTGNGSSIPCLRIHKNLSRVKLPHDPGRRPVKYLS
jgi:hypothetical protein